MDAPKQDAILRRTESVYFWRAACNCQTKLSFDEVETCSLSIVAALCYRYFFLFEWLATSTVVYCHSLAV